jgi:transcriptional regulator with XRE-family HTH domain
MERVTVEPRLLRWAIERSRVPRARLVKRFPRLEAWSRGEVEPTLKQLEALAKATHVPIGYLFLAEPPHEPVPIPDLRTMADRPLERPSPELLDTLYLCQPVGALVGRRRVAREELQADTACRG